MNTNSEAWREVAALAQREIASLKDRLCTNLNESDTASARAEIRAWNKVLALGDEPAPVVELNFGMSNV